MSQKCNTGLQWVPLIHKKAPSLSPEYIHQMCLWQYTVYILYMYIWVIGLRLRVNPIYTV